MATPSCSAGRSKTTPPPLRPYRAAARAAPRAGRAVCLRRDAGRGPLAEDAARADSSETRFRAEADRRRGSCSPPTSRRRTRPANLAAGRFHRRRCGRLFRSSRDLGPDRATIERTLSAGCPGLDAAGGPVPTAGARLRRAELRRRRAPPRRVRWLERLPVCRDRRTYGRQGSACPPPKRPPARCTTGSPTIVALEAAAVMDLDPRYIFFRLASDDGGEPQGASGATLIAGRSLAVDPTHHPYFELFHNT